LTLSLTRQQRKANEKIYGRLGAARLERAEAWRREQLVKAREREEGKLARCD
jgi:hypothetical protein